MTSTTLGRLQPNTLSLVTRLQLRHRHPQPDSAEPPHGQSQGVLTARPASLCQPVGKGVANLRQSKNGLDINWLRNNGSFGPEPQPVDIPRLYGLACSSNTFLNRLASLCGSHLFATASTTSMRVDPSKTGERLLSWKGRSSRAWTHDLAVWESLDSARR